MIFGLLGGGPVPGNGGGTAQVVPSVDELRALGQAQIDQAKKDGAP